MQPRDSERDLDRPDPNDSIEDKLQLIKDARNKCMRELSPRSDMDAVSACFLSPLDHEKDDPAQRYLPAYQKDGSPEEDKPVARMPNGDTLTVNASDPEQPWQMQDSDGKPVKVLPLLTREIRQPPWSEMSNGATYFPAHQEIDTFLGDRVPAQPNHIISYPDGSAVEFNNRGIVDVRTKGSR
jgi:hypothetical protein